MAKEIFVIKTNGFAVLCKGKKCTLHCKEFKECLWCNHYSSEVASVSNAEGYKPCNFFGTEQIG